MKNRCHGETKCKMYYYSSLCTYKTIHMWASRKSIFLLKIAVPIFKFSSKFSSLCYLNFFLILKKINVKNLYKYFAFFFILNKKNFLMGGLCRISTFPTSHAKNLMCIRFYNNSPRLFYMFLFSEGFYDQEGKASILNPP